MAKSATTTAIDLSKMLRAKLMDPTLGPLAITTVTSASAGSARLALMVEEGAAYLPHVVIGGADGVLAYALKKEMDAIRKGKCKL
jgi:hypothetical protein